ncbi:MAG: hypothetical protein NVSMB23_17380 [Myxococcales bacterium]
MRVSDGGAGGGAQPDAGGPDGGRGILPDAGPDAGVPPDGGVPDGGLPDGGALDGGVPTTFCNGTHCYDSSGAVPFGTPGPWPVANEQFSAAQGIRETPVIGVTTDEAQNLWVATNTAIYLLKPGQASFTRFSGRDGLHTSENPIRYCDDFGPADAQTVSGTPLPRCVTGQGDAPGIISIVGGGPNEVFVGYASTNQYGLMGYSPSSTDPTENTPHEVVGTWMDPNRHDGKVDRVRVATDKTLIVDRFDFVSYNSAMFWHDKSAYRMVFDHFVHPHELYVGTEHGVDRVQPDKYSMPPLNAEGRYPSWFLPSTYPWLGDHLHPRACYHQWCTGDESAGDNQRMGDWFALALDAKGDLWVGGRWSAGKIFWAPKNVDTNPDGSWWLQNPPGTPASAPQPQGWQQRGGGAYADPATGQHFTYGDPWCGSSGQTSVYDLTYTDPATGRHFRPTSCTPNTGTPPVFPVPQEGDVAAITAVTVAPDGRVWWAGASVNAGDPSYGLAVQTPPSTNFTYIDPASFGMSDTVRDLVALPDGRIALGGDTTGLWLLNPATMTATNIRAGQGIPGNRVLRLELDSMVNPPALHVATDAGGASLRQIR